MMPPPTPSRRTVEEGTIREGQHYDFKEQIDVESEHGKSKFVDQVVAFLNASGGHLIVGVKEKGGVWKAFRPMIGDSHAWAERIRSLLTQHVDPVPNSVETHAIDVDGGFILDIRVAEHGMQPYQNRLTGGFYVRTDRQNRPIPRDEIQSYFKRAADYRADLASLASEERARLGRRDVMLEDGPVLEIAVLPREHYDDLPPFRFRSNGVVIAGPAFPHHGPGRSTFRACEGGSEATEMTDGGKLITRFFVSDDWFLHATIVHPFSMTEGEGRVTIHEMRAKLAAYLEDVGGLMAESGVRGPYAVSFRFAHLRRSERVRWIFDFDGPVVAGPRGLVEAFDPSALARDAYEAIRGASHYA